jgi:kynureninase
MHLALDKLEIREAGRACARKPASSFLVSTAPTRSSNATQTMLDIVTAVKVQKVRKKEAKEPYSSRRNTVLDSYS